MVKYIAAYYDEHGKLTDLNGARADGVKISRRHRGGMVYINKDMLGNPWGVVYKDGKNWIWEPRWTGGRWIIDPKTGKTIKRD